MEGDNKFGWCRAKAAPQPEDLNFTASFGEGICISEHFGDCLVLPLTQGQVTLVEREEWGDKSTDKEQTSRAVSFPSFRADLGRTCVKGLTTTTNYSERSKHKNVQKNAYLLWTFSRNSPLPSHKTTLKQQINGYKR